MRIIRTNAATICGLRSDARQKDVARIQVRNMLGAVPGAIAPVVVGGRDRSVMVYLDPAKM
ncbi:MAG: hypothetical protein ACKOS8_10735, partial [Gemmataceae bacterium]